MVLARDLDVPVLALSQLNRSLEYRAEKLRCWPTFVNPARWNEDADIVAFIYRADTRHTWPIGPP